MRHENTGMESKEAEVESRHDIKYTCLHSSHCCNSYMVPARQESPHSSHHHGPFMFPTGRNFCLHKPWVIHSECPLGPGANGPPPPPHPRSPP